MNKQQKQQFNKSLATGWRGYEGSKCGGGSDPQFAQPCFEQLLKMREEVGARLRKAGELVSIAELGCGDLCWHLNRTNELNDYVGYDLHKWPNWRNSKAVLMDGFDLTEHIQEKNSDLVIVRDVFIHLSYDDLLDFLKIQIKCQRAKFVAFTADLRIDKNPHKPVRSKKATRFNPELRPLNFRGEWFKPWFLLDIRITP